MRGESVRIGIRLSAIILLGALALQPAFAEDAGSSGARDSAPQHQSGEGAGAGNGARHDGGAAKDGKNSDAGGQRLPADSRGTPAAGGRPPDGAASDSKASDSKALDVKTPDNVDTRSGMPPRRLNDGRPINARTESPPGRNFQRRLSLAPDASRPVVRNSIGLPISPRGIGERHDREHFDTQHATHNPALETPGITGSQAGRFSRVEGHIGVPAPNANPIVRPIAPNRAAINGTGMTNHGVGPSRIGGPTAAAGGISGTTIKPKH